MDFYMHSMPAKRHWLVAALMSAIVIASLVGGCTGLSSVNRSAADAAVVAADATIEAQRQDLAAALAASDQLPGAPQSAAFRAFLPALSGQEQAPAGTGPAPAEQALQTPEAPGRPTAQGPATGTSEPQPVSGPTPQGLAHTENILVLGTDYRPNDTVWRTDSIMVVAIDRNARQVGIISVPRDLYVSIPGYGKERINAADYIGERTHYPGGGPALVRRTLALATGIPTEHYVQIKQDGLTKLVDALGGVTVDLACPLYEMAPDSKHPGRYEQFSLPAGQVHLDGATAKKFATYRYVETNFGRERRQQQLVWAIRNRVLQGDVLGRIPQLWSALSDVFTTDLSLPDVIELASFGVSLRSKDVHSTSITQDLVQDYTTSQGGMVLILRSQAALQARLATLFAAKPLADVGKPEKGACPAPPRGFPNLNPTPTPAK